MKAMNAFATFTDGFDHQDSTRSQLYGVRKALRKRRLVKFSCGEHDLKQKHHIRVEVRVVQEDER